MTSFFCCKCLKGSVQLTMAMSMFLCKECLAEMKKQMNSPNIIPPSNISLDDIPKDEKPIA
jgi:hypothetical protein